MRRTFRAAAAEAAIICASQAFAAARVALLIGNAAYKSQHVPANPANDAADVGAMLRLSRAGRTFRPAANQVKPRSATIRHFPGARTSPSIRANLSFLPFSPCGRRWRSCAG